MAPARNATTQMTKRLALTLLAAVTLAAGAAGCGSSTATSSAGGGSSQGQSTAAVRPPSPATVTIVEPQSGAVVHGASVHVAVRVEGATIEPLTTTNIRGDRGHVHLYLDSGIVYMNYTLQQDLPVAPGPNTLQAEFVASDHAPFSPRVMSPTVLFTVQ